jgi:hypothetical protein
LTKNFSSSSLQIESEDSLFQIITEMIEEDNHRMILLKEVKLDYVSGNFLERSPLMKLIMRYENH